MALFKISKGTAANLSSSVATNTTHDGFAYFTTDDGKFYIDIKDNETPQIGVNRIPLNANIADRAYIADKAIIADAANVITTDLYWANLLVDTASNSSTTPTFGSVIIGDQESGIYLRDSANISYGALWDNGSNLWVGAKGSNYTGHVGKLYLHAGINNNTDKYVNQSVYLGVGGNATSTVASLKKITFKEDDENTTGSSIQPVYAKATGELAPISYTVNANVPDDAKFTDTTYALETGDSLGQIKVIPSSGANYNVNVNGISDGLYWANLAVSSAANVNTSPAFKSITINATSNYGAVNKPIYWDNGIPKEIDYTINANIPTDAQFTDTWVALNTSVPGYVPIKAPDDNNQFLDGKATWSKPKFTIDTNHTIEAGDNVTSANLKSWLGLTNAVHYIGQANVALTDGGIEDPNINGYDFDTDRQPGDIVLGKDGDKEYIWGYNGWELLGPVDTIQAGVTTGIQDRMAYYSANNMIAAANYHIYSSQGYTINANTNSASYFNAVNNNGAVSLYAATDRGLYDATNSKWIVQLTQDSNNTYIPNWKNIGANNKFVYFNNSGEPVATNATIGGTAKLWYLNAGVATDSIANVGSTIKPVYLTNGNITATSANVGGTKQFVYMVNGNITATTTTVGGTEQPVYSNAGVLTNTAYYLKANIESGTENRAAYYSGVRKIEDAGSIYMDTTTIGFLKDDGAYDLIKNTYNSTSYHLLYDHHNGNISLSASSVGLYLGYYSTTLINFLSGAGVWNSTGLGIGTTSPSYKLHVLGTSYFNNQMYINYSNDVALNTTSGSLIIGDKAGENLAFDGNEIMARNNGAKSALYLNDLGGAVYINNKDNTYIRGPLLVGYSDAAADTGYATANSGSKNYIAFYGVNGDGPGSYNHTYIGESIYGSKTESNEKSELLLFKGNDVSATAGPDRIRLFAKEIEIQNYAAALSGTWDTIRATSGTRIANFTNNKVTVDGKIFITQSANNRDRGIIGTYDSTKTAAIWSMGSDYQIPADGSGLGTLYGAAYAYQNRDCIGGHPYASGHQFLWCANGTINVALGTNLWARNTIIASSDPVSVAAIGTNNIGSFIYNNGIMKLNSAANNWAYLRIHNGSNVWDIASRSDQRSGALQFRPAGVEKLWITTAGEVVTNVAAKQTFYTGMVNGTAVFNIRADAIGTNTAVGLTYMTIGNTQANVNASNSKGRLYLGKSGSAWHVLLGESNNTTSHWHYLPDSTGWVATGGNGTSTGVGGTTQPIYLNANGVLTNTSYSLSATVAAGTAANRLAYYSTTTNIKSYDSTKGGTTKLWYLNSGVPTDSAANVGNNQQPVYLSSGVITAGLTMQSLRGGTAIAANTNLNTLFTVGNYYCAATVDSKTLTNIPLPTKDMSAFTMKIGYSTGTGYPYQQIHFFNTHEIWRRYNSSTSNTSSWGAWQNQTALSITNVGTHSLVAGDNIDNLSIFGTYYCSSSGVTANLAGTKPFASGSGFKLYNIANYYAPYNQQILTATDTGFFFRQRDASTTAWREWKQMAYVKARTQIGSGIIPVYVASGGSITASTSTAGTATRPIWLDGGTLKQGSYELKATVAAGGAANRLAYYSTTTNIKSYDSNAGTQYIPIYLNAGVPTQITTNSVLTNLASTTAASTYAASPRPGITGTLGTANGGTGNTSYTASRLVYTNTATKLATGTIVSDGNYVYANSGNLRAGSWTANTAGGAERDVIAASGAGQIYLYSAAAIAGNRGIWIKNASGDTSTGLLIVNQSNQITTHAPMATNLLPDAATTRNLGSTTLNWSAIYGNNHSIHRAGKWYGDFHINTVGTTSTKGITLLRIGNNVASGTDANAQGYLRIYSSNTHYTDILSQGNGDRTFYLPNYAGTMYATHVSSNSAVGSNREPVYVAANGQIKKCTGIAIPTSIEYDSNTFTTTQITITLTNGVNMKCYETHIPVSIPGANNYCDLTIMFYTLRTSDGSDLINSNTMLRIQNDGTSTLVYVNNAFNRDSSYTSHTDTEWYSYNGSNWMTSADHVSVHSGGIYIESKTNYKSSYTYCLVRGLAFTKL